MGNTFHSLNSDYSRAELRQFGLVFASAIILIFGLFFPWLRDNGIQFTRWPWILALALVAISLIAPSVLGPLNRIWLFIGYILGYINTRIILGFIFAIMFIPGAFLLKLFRKDPMCRAIDGKQTSYRVVSNQPKLKNLNRPY